SLSRRFSVRSAAETLSAKLEPVRTPAPQPAPPFTRVYAISTSPAFAQVFLDGATSPMAWPMKATLGEATHRFVVQSPMGSREFSYQVRRGDPVRTLVLRYDSGELVTRTR